MHWTVSGYRDHITSWKNKRESLLCVSVSQLLTSALCQSFIIQLNRAYWVTCYFILLACCQIKGQICLNRPYIYESAEPFYKALEVKSQFIGCIMGRIRKVRTQGVSCRPVRS